MYNVMPYFFATHLKMHAYGESVKCRVKFIFERESRKIRFLEIP
jgi:hypothetical protein